MIQQLQHLTSAWKGLEGFAVKLVEHTQPKVIVELGVDFGFSTFAFAMPNIGKVYGIDWFQGDEHAGHRNTYDDVVREMNNLRLTNIELIKSDFSEAVKKWDKKIDILHIDGVHHYASVKQNYEEWLPFLSDTGVILMHDTLSFKNDVGKFFDEIQLPKFNIPHSHGLGVVCRSSSVLEAVEKLSK